MRRLFFCIVFGLFALTTQSACASGPFDRGGLFDGATSAPVTLEQTLRSVRAGDIVIVPESHGFEVHHAHQREVLNFLKAAGLRISVGMEFFDITQQSDVDAYTSGKLPEADFLKKVNWGSIPFGHYREQVLFPSKAGGKTVALNAPRSLTGVIAQKGIDQLSPEQKAMLPPGFELGNMQYRERFTETMKGHVPDEQIDRYFQAQSVWDETMAFTAAEYLKVHPEQTLVIIVGDFHVAYGGGLPDRLRARGVPARVVFSQIRTGDFPGAELERAVVPHPRFGPRGDAIWVAP